MDVVMGFWTHNGLVHGYQTPNMVSVAFTQRAVHLHYTLPFPEIPTFFGPNIKHEYASDTALIFILVKIF
jgi:hypothetical protein